MHRVKTTAAFTVATLGALLTIGGVLGDGRIDLADLRGLGIGMGIASLMWYFVSRGRCLDSEVYEAGRQAGYDAGYIDGRRVAKPVVLQLPREGFAGDGPAGEFAKQGNVTNGTERVGQFRGRA